MQSKRQVRRKYQSSDLTRQIPTTGEELSESETSQAILPISDMELNHTPTHVTAAPLRRNAVQRMQRSRGNTYVQRALSRVQRSGNGVTYGVNIGSTGGGQLLPRGVRDKMQGTLGENFSDVRIHSDGQAERLAHVRLPLAVTFTSHKGNITPTLRTDKRLLGMSLPISFSSARVWHKHRPTMGTRLYSTTLRWRLRRTL